MPGGFTKAEGLVTGLQRLRAVVEKVAVPVVAIGGITTDNVREVFRTGARYAAVVSAIHQAEDIAETYQELSATAGIPPSFLEHGPSDGDPA